ncbi:cysteine-rich CWC family protein [Metabacillus halosaccharovorans]|uniref:cysteine-rich CWC family protein n=1 Tax=Metabacillus halosaccharovorans TaxID=930124 RepID=UPI00355635C2
MNKCPICNGENNCGILDKKASCWCMNITIPEKVLALSGSNKDRCICLTCILKDWDQTINLKK